MATRSIEREDARGRLVNLLQEVSADVDEGAGPAVVGEFGDEGFGLLDEALEGGGAGLAEADC